MTDRNNNPNIPKPLHELIRSQIVQRYPLQNNIIDGFKFEWDQNQQRYDPLDMFMKDDIVEDYPEFQQPPRRGLFSLNQPMNSENLNNNRMRSRNQSISPGGKFPLQKDHSLEKIPFMMKKFSDDMMDEEVDIIKPPINFQQNMRMDQQPQWNYELQRNNNIINHRPADTFYEVQKQREKSQKISKLRQVGCNCRKSKCLKMYCECFNLQIFCGQNCNCVGCGNVQPNAKHKEAVIDALTRNPKAFNEAKPKIENAFNGMKEVRKGCKCKKTKCLKKYCECFNSGVSCGIFCKCENCQNGK